MVESQSWTSGVNSGCPAAKDGYNKSDVERGEIVVMCRVEGKCDKQHHNTLDVTSPHRRSIIAVASSPDRSISFQIRQLYI